MGKIGFILIIATLLLEAKGLEQDCLSCHKAQQIPNELIYRRYLMKYSTSESMKEAMVKYLQNPKKEYSIMPSQFFLKFPMKEALALDEKVLEENIQMFFETFDVKKKLILKK